MQGNSDDKSEERTEAVRVWTATVRIRGLSISGIVPVTMGKRLTYEIPPVGLIGRQETGSDGAVAIDEPPLEPIYTDTGTEGTGIVPR